MESIIDKQIRFGKINFFLKWKFGEEDPMRPLDEQLQFSATGGSIVIRTPLSLRADTESQIENLINYLTELKNFLSERRKIYDELQTKKSEENKKLYNPRDLQE